MLLAKETWYETVVPVKPQRGGCSYSGLLAAVANLLTSREYAAPDYNHRRMLSVLRLSLLPCIWLSELYITSFNKEAENTSLNKQLKTQ